MIKLNGNIITPTIFPDGTSQVWKIAGLDIENKHNTVTWNFENEAEVIQVCQLGDLLGRRATIYIPFLPYGRQDKKISNETTFGLATFMQIINIFYGKIDTLDAHSNQWFSARTESHYPENEIANAIEATGCDSVCFPDNGAMLRYEIPLRTIILDKTRDQTTGDILGLEIKSGNNFVKNSVVLIVDDICDGGRTFIEAAKLLYKQGASEVNLYTTHGIYSKGIEVLREAGIKHIFNYKGEV